MPRLRKPKISNTAIKVGVPILAALITSAAIIVAVFLDDEPAEPEQATEASPTVDIEASPTVDAEASPTVDIEVNVNVKPDATEPEPEREPTEPTEPEPEREPTEPTEPEPEREPTEPEPEREPTEPTEPEPEREPTEPTEPEPEREPTETTSTGTSAAQYRLDAYKRDVKLDDCWTSGSDQWCFIAGQATSYVAWRINEVRFGGENVFHNEYKMRGRGTWGNATDWDDAAFDALELPKGELPSVGSVAQWEADDPHPRYGFVAYVESVTHNDDGDVTSIVMSDMNSDSMSKNSNPDTWNLRDAVTCTRSQCQPFGWPDNFINIPDP